MDVNDVFGEVLEQTASAAKQTAQTVASQVGVPVPVSDSQVTPDVSNKEIVKSLYEESQPQRAVQQANEAQTSGSSNTQDELAKTRADLSAAYKQHTETYYDPTFNPPKQEEESVVEKVEREKQEEMVDLQEKQMEKPPELVQRAAQRVEKFPGASG